MILLLCYITGSLYRIQIIYGQAYSSAKDSSYVRSMYVPGKRGRILDRNGQELAANKETFSVCFSPSNKGGDVNAAFLSAAQILRSSDKKLEVKVPMAFYDTSAPSAESVDWNTSNVDAFLKDNGLKTHNAAEAVRALCAKYGLSGATDEQAAVLLPFLNPVNSLTKLCEASDDELNNIIGVITKHSKIFTVERRGEVSDVLVINGEFNLLTIDSRMNIIREIESVTAISFEGYPVIYSGGIFWQDGVVRRFLKNNSLERADAAEAYAALCKKYSLDEIPREFILDVLALRCELSARGYMQYLPIVMAKKVDIETVSKIEERSISMPGVFIEVDYERYYPNGSLLSQTLGYVGNITAEDKERYLALSYDINDIVGRSGLEYTLEEYLRGSGGHNNVLVNNVGRIISHLDESTAKNGSDVYLTIDLKLQRTVENALYNTMRQIRAGDYGEIYPNALVGAVVVQKVNTGEILAMASLPGYDPNDFAGGISTEKWQELNPFYPSSGGANVENLDPTLPRPMINNAIGAAFPPGSTFKMAVGAGAMMEDILDVDERIYDYGRYTKYSKEHAPACWIYNENKGSHGYESIVSALRDSCNYFFFEAGDRLGIDKINDYAKLFGLGQKTGIDLPGEISGMIAGPESTKSLLSAFVKNKLVSILGEAKSKSFDLTSISRDMVYNGNITDDMKNLGFASSSAETRELRQYIQDYSWKPAQTLNACIGQGETNVTVLQMAGYTSAMANGVNRYAPQIVSRVETGGAITKTFSTEAIPINIPDGIHESIKKGMGAVTTSTEGRAGTAARFFKDFKYKIGGKTGTAQAAGKEPYAWFVGFAPYDNPEISIAVMIARGGHGSYCSPVARAIIEEYMRGEAD